jgi:MinD-like ATPase involved in chromosome partitioning or flagellar assembly
MIHRPKIISITSIKGGIGKTFISQQLANHLDEKTIVVHCGPEFIKNDLGIESNNDTSFDEIFTNIDNLKHIIELIIESDTYNFIVIDWGYTNINNLTLDNIDKYLCCNLLLFNYQSKIDMVSMINYDQLNRNLLLRTKNYLVANCYSNKRPNQMQVELENILHKKRLQILGTIPKKESKSGFIDFEFTESILLILKDILSK